MECNINFEAIAWSRITPEAKDLVQRMVEKEPLLRISAKDALAHPWFTLENNNSNQLSLPQENINKYCGVRYFNIETIKPDFSRTKNSAIKELDKDLLKQDINSSFTKVNPKFECDLCEVIEFSNKLVIPHCERDAFNLEEDDISERSEHELSPLDRIFMTTGVGEFLDSPLKRKIKSYSKPIELTPLGSLECDKKCSNEASNFTKMVNGNNK